MAVHFTILDFGLDVVSAAPLHLGIDEDDLAGELFRSPSSEDINEKIYAYAVYDSLRLITNSNSYTFRSNIEKKQVPRYDYNFVSNNGYSELWYNAGVNKVVVIVRKNRWFIEALTFFAYLFGIYLLLTVTRLPCTTVVQ